MILRKYIPRAERFRIELSSYSIILKLNSGLTLVLCIGLQARRNAKLNGEASKNKPKAEDIAQWFKKRRLDTPTKPMIVTSKDLKRKMSHGDKKPEPNKIKPLETKRQKTRVGDFDSKSFDGLQLIQTDGKGLFKTERWVPPHASTTSGLHSCLRS